MGSVHIQSYVISKGATPSPLAIIVNIALSSDYWIFGTFISSIISKATTKSWNMRRWFGNQYIK